MRGYKPLTKQDQYTIEQMVEPRQLQNQMANYLQRSPTTISRERHRNPELRIYQHHKADCLPRERHQGVPRKIPFIAKKKALVREQLKQKLSFDQISNTPETQGGISIRPQRIYIFFKIRQREESCMRIYAG